MAPKVAGSSPGDPTSLKPPRVEALCTVTVRGQRRAELEARKFVLSDRDLGVVDAWYSVVFFVT